MRYREIASERLPVSHPVHAEIVIDPAEVGGSATAADTLAAPANEHPITTA